MERAVCVVVFWRRPLLKICFVAGEFVGILLVGDFVSGRDELVDVSCLMMCLELWLIWLLSLP